MKLSTTLIVLLLFVLALGSYFKLQPVSIPEPEETVDEIMEAPTELLKLAESERVTWFQIQNIAENTIITLKLEGNNWMISFPIEDHANHQVVETFIQKILMSQKEQTLTPEKDWDEYGLRNPSLKIGIETSGDGGRRYLYLGDTTPVGHTIFARWEGDETYFLIEKNIKEVFSRSLYSIREKRVFLNGGQKPERIYFRVDGESFKLKYRDDLWFWERPVSLFNHAANQESVEKILTGLQELYAKDFVEDGGGDSAEAGFSEKSDFLKIWTGEDTSSAVVLGREYAARDAFFAKRDGEKAVFLIERGRLRAILQNIVTLASEAQGF